MTPTPEERAQNIYMGHVPMECDPICLPHRAIADAIRAAVAEAESRARLEEREAMRPILEPLMCSGCEEFVSDPDRNGCGMCRAARKWIRSRSDATPPRGQAETKGAGE